MYIWCTIQKMYSYIVTVRTSVFIKEIYAIKLLLNPDKTSTARRIGWDSCRVVAWNRVQKESWGL